MSRKPAAHRKITTAVPLAAIVEAPFNRDHLTRQAQWLIATACGLVFVPLLHGAVSLLIATPVLDRSFLRQTFLLPVDAFSPEPVERLTFLLATVLVPLLMLAVLKVCTKASPYLSDAAVRKAWLSAVAGSIGAMALVIACIQPDALILREFFPSTPQPVLRLLAGLVLTALTFLYGHRISHRWATAGLVLTCIAIPLALALFTIATTNEGPRNYIEGPNMDAVIFSLAQVTQGRALLVDTANQYGLYPEFLAPLFQIIGLNVLSFTVTMWLLITASFLCIALLLWKNIESKWLVPLALLSVAHYGYFSSRTWLSDDPYPQYHPIRFLFPCVCLYLFSKYISRPSSTLYYACLVTSALSLFWNPDSGVAVFGAWMCLLAYREFSSHPVPSALRATAIHAGRGLIIALSLTLSYSGYTLVRYHVLPHWDLLTVNVPVFYRYGGMMLPLPPNHPWTLIIALYTLTFARAGYSLLRRESVPRQQLLLVTAVLGTGLFTYYQGRSHDNNLTMVVWPAVVLLACYADELLKWCKPSQDRIMFTAASLSAFTILFLLSFPILMIPDVVRATDSYLSEKIRSVRANESGRIRKNVQALRQYSKPGQLIGILSFRAGVYHAETNTASIFTGPGLTEMLWRSQLDSLNKQIESLPDVPIFIDFQDVLDGPAESYFPAWATSLALEWIPIEQNLSQGGSLALFRRDLSSPAAVSWLLPEDHAPIAHVHGSSKGFLTGQRGRFAGFFKIAEPKSVSARSFTIEAVVRPEGPQGPWATIVSTHPGAGNNQGFVLHHVPEHNNSYVPVFGNGRGWVAGPEFTLQSKVTSYLCVVLREDMVRVYVNGENAGEFTVSGGMAKSDFPISVGNWEQMERPFNGTVSELLLSEREVTASEVAARWSALRPKVQ